MLHFPRPETLAQKKIVQLERPQVGLWIDLGQLETLSQIDVSTRWVPGRKIGGNLVARGSSGLKPFAADRIRQINMCPALDAAHCPVNCLGGAGEIPQSPTKKTPLLPPLYHPGGTYFEAAGLYASLSSRSPAPSPYTTEHTTTRMNRNVQILK